MSLFNCKEGYCIKWFVLIVVTEGDESFEVTMTATEMRDGELESDDPSETTVETLCLLVLYSFNCWLCMDLILHLVCYLFISDYVGSM